MGSLGIAHVYFCPLSAPPTFAHLNENCSRFSIPIPHHEVGMHPQSKGTVEKDSPWEEACIAGVREDDVD